MIGLKMPCRGYLDIETTGLSRTYAELTVVGIGFEQGDSFECIQLVGDRITTHAVVRLLTRANVFYTYNGLRFDLPFIKAKLGVDLADYAGHRDLMYQCWNRKLFGGLKVVETTLGITRQTQGIDGRMAVRLWYQYLDNYDRQALELLLRYNAEDVRNLMLLRKKLGVD